MAWIAKYICYRASDQILFSGQATTVAKFCKTWEGYPANAFRIRAWAGPMEKADWYSIPLTCLVVDWYFYALSKGNHHVVRKLEDMLLGGKV